MEKLRLNTHNGYHQPTEQLRTTSPVELFSGPVGWTFKLDDPTLVWITSFPHTLGGRPGCGNNIVLLSRDFADLRNAQTNLRQPGKDPSFDDTYGIQLHTAREEIIKRSEPRKKKWWPQPKMPPIQMITNKKHARKLDDEQEDRIANAFAEHLIMDDLPPSLAQDLDFNTFYKRGVVRNANYQPQFPLVFRAMVPNDWRGLSPDPADEHNIHVLELTESVRDDLTRFWFKTWDWIWPEPDLYKTSLMRMKSWSSRYEIDDGEGMMPVLLKHADTVATEKDDGRRRGSFGKSIYRTFRRFEAELLDVITVRHSRRRVFA